MSANLVDKLRQETAKPHSMAENVSFVKSFLGGAIDKNFYPVVVANLYFAYSVIEKELFNDRHH